MSDQTAKKPQPDPAERNAFFPSSYSLSQFTSPKFDLSGADYPTPYKGGKNILIIGADERYLLTDNGTFFSIGNHPVETLLPMYHLDKAGFTFDVATGSAHRCRTSRLQPNRCGRQSHPARRRPRTA